MSTSPPSLLVADDSADAVETLAMLFEFDGYRVFTALDGESAWALAERERPEVAVLDIGMPRLSGLDLARRLRGTDWGRAMLLVAVTGWGREDDRVAAIGAGFDHHLVKPVDATALAASLDGWLQAARARRAG
jgi:two-component system, chemotaxis family, CheB/CheR fusion protein